MVTLARQLTLNAAFTNTTWCRVAILTILFSITGCATELKSNSELAKEQSADFLPSEIVKQTNDQDIILAQLQRRAGLTSAQNNVSNWDVIIAAGIEYSDSKCEAYMGALARLNRDKKTTISEIGLVGTAAAGVMAAAKSAAKEIALVAIAFGLASSTVDNLGGNVLYEVEPSSVRALVKALQSKYKDGLPKGYSSRPAAMNVIRGYAALCTPITIEAELNHAVKNAQPKGVSGEVAAGRAPEATNAQITVDAKYSPDESSRLIGQFIRVNGVIDEGQRRKVEAFMRASGISDQVSILGFLNSAEYTEQRLKAIEFFHLTK